MFCRFSIWPFSPARLAVDHPIVTKLSLLGHTSYHFRGIKTYYDSKMCLCSWTLNQKIYFCSCRNRNDLEVLRIMVLEKSIIVKKIEYNYVQRCFSANRLTLRHIQTIIPSYLVRYSHDSIKIMSSSFRTWRISAHGDEPSKRNWKRPASLAASW